MFQSIEFGPLDKFSHFHRLAIKHVFLKVKVYKADTVCQVNPPKVSEPQNIKTNFKIPPLQFDCSEDMADLTFLGDACVLWNSVVRYKNELIYTYSGLFCIAINPYKRFPIYTLRTMELYVGKRGTSVGHTSSPLLRAPTKE